MRLSCIVVCPDCGLRTTIIGLWGHILTHDRDECKFIAQHGDVKRFEMLVMMLALNIPMTPEIILKIMDSMVPAEVMFNARTAQIARAIVEGAADAIENRQEPPTGDAKTPPLREWKTWDDNDSTTNQRHD